MSEDRLQRALALLVGEVMLAGVAAMGMVLRNRRRTSGAALANA